MAGRERRSEELAATRNLAAGVVALVAAIAGVAGAADASTWLKVALAGAVAVGALAVLVLHVLERRSATREASPAGVERPVPRLLPKRPMTFVNRKDELSDLNKVMERAESSGRPLVAVLAGLPGVGKSIIGNEWAHNVGCRFAGGVLWADFSERRRGAAIDVSGVLGKFIEELGTAGVAIPAKLSDRANLFRNITADRRVLVLLDDVTEAAQVQQLRPAGAGSVVVATTYKTFEELHYEGATLVPVDPLPDDRALGLLVEMAGPFGNQFKEAAAETKRVVALCGGLPLPLCVCAARLLVGAGTRTVASIVAEIEDEEQRLRVLSGKGEYAGAAVFGFAYDDLEPGDRLVYRRLGLHPGLDLDAVHVALLTEADLRVAQAGLEALADTHLLQPRLDGRYRFHQLVRVHSRESIEREDPERVREASIRRLLDWYYAAVRSADRMIVPERLRLARDEEIRTDHLPEFASRETAFDWLERERANLLGVMVALRDREWDERAWQMAEALWPFHHNRRHYADWIDVCEIGVLCARRAGHHEAEARVRVQLARAFIDLGNFERARTELEQSERAARSSTKMRLQASIRECVGICSLSEGDYDLALEVFRQAREMFESFGGARGAAIQDYFIGRALTARGEYREAAVALERALTCMRKIDDRLFIGRILLRCAQAVRRDGRLDEAEAGLHEGLAVLAPLGMRLEEAESYEELAAIADARRDARAAAEHREHAQDIYRAIGHPRARGRTSPAAPSPSVG